VWLKLFKFIIALLLVPVCIGGARTLWFVVSAAGSADVVWVPLLAGVACWLVIYLLLPKPTLVYVFGHELTHAFWTLIFGGKLKRFKATSKGGHVVVSKDNFLIFLSPYFFPIYAIIIVVCYVIGGLIWDFERYRAIFHILLGIAYAFHITFTINALQTEQSDIKSQGTFFSLVIIFIGNILVLIIALPVLSGFSIITTLRFWLIMSLDAYRWLLIGTGLLNSQ